MQACPRERGELTIITKVSGNLNFFIDGKQHKAKNIRDETPWSKMKQNNKLGYRYRYKRMMAVHPVLGKVLLIISVFYDEKHDKYRRILLMTTDLDMRAPSAIWAYTCPRERGEASLACGNLLQDHETAASLRSFPVA